MKREITNKEVDTTYLKGLLEGLTHTYNSLVRVSKDPEYRGDLSEELKRIEGEIKLTKEELDKLYQGPPDHPKKETEFERAYRMGRNSLVLELRDKITPIELPSDEEIVKNTIKPLHGLMDKWDQGFLSGAKWMRDKIQGGDK